MKLPHPHNPTVSVSWIIELLKKECNAGGGGGSFSAHLEHYRSLHNPCDADLINFHIRKLILVRRETFFSVARIMQTPVQPKEKTPNFYYS